MAVVISSPVWCSVWQGQVDSLVLPPLPPITEVLPLFLNLIRGVICLPYESERSEGGRYWDWDALYITNYMVDRMDGSLALGYASYGREECDI